MLSSFSPSSMSEQLGLDTLIVNTRDIARALAVALIVTTLKTQLNNLWVAGADGFLHNYGAIIHTWVADQEPVNMKRLEP